MKQLVLKLDVNDDQDVKIALDRIARISGKYETKIDPINKLCTVTGDKVDPIQIVRKLRKLGHIDVVTVEPPTEPEKKKGELVGVGNENSLAAAVGPPKELKKKEPMKQEEEKKSKKIMTDVKEDPNESLTTTKIMKVVLKLDLHDGKAKQRVIMTVSNISGVDAISMDMKKQMLTVIGDIDPAHIESELRKLYPTEILSAGPAKEPGKKKDEPKKQKDQKKKDQDPVAELVDVYQAYNPLMPKYYYAQSVETDPTLAVTVGPSKEPEKKKEEQKRKEPREQEEKKKDKIEDPEAELVYHLEDSQSTKEDPKESLLVTSGPLKELEKKKKESKEEHYEDHVAELVKADQAYNPPMTTYYHKAVLKLDLHDDKDRKEAMNTVSSVSGVDSITMDMKNKKLTVMGDADPVDIVVKLRKLCPTEIVTVGPAKLSEKKKEEPKKGDQMKKEQDHVAELVKTYQKAVLKLDLHDDKAKKEAMKTVSSLSGVNSISMDMKDKKLTVIGDVDPVDIVAKLRKLCNTEIITVGPAKEPEKKKEEPKKEDQKKEDQDPVEWVKAYKAYNPQMATYYNFGSAEDNPNACVIS